MSNASFSQPENNADPPADGSIEDDDYYTRQEPSVAFFMGTMLFITFLLLLVRRMMRQAFEPLVSMEEREQQQRQQTQARRSNDVQRAILLSYFESTNYQMKVTPDSLLCASQEKNDTIVDSDNDVMDVLVTTTANASANEKETPGQEGNSDIEQGSEKQQQQQSVDTPVVKVNHDDNKITTALETTHLVLPCRPEHPISVPCAICLEPYHVNDWVVWSASSQCKHCFHRDCLIDYLCKVKSRQTPCPCCRQEFCDLPDDDDDGVKAIVDGEMSSSFSDNTGLVEDSLSSSRTTTTSAIVVAEVEEVEPSRLNTTNLSRRNE